LWYHGRTGRMWDNRLWGRKKKCQPLFRAQIRPLDPLISTTEAKHGSSNQRNRSGSVSPIRPRIRLRFGGVNTTNGFSHVPAYPAYSSGFSHVPAYSSCFLQVPAYSSGFSHVPPYSSCFSHVPAYSSGSSHVPPYSSCFSDDPPYSSGFSHVPAYSSGSSHVPPYSSCF
jgi:hypothetical protein